MTVTFCDPVGELPVPRNLIWEVDLILMVLALGTLDSLACLHC